MTEIIHVRGGQDLEDTKTLIYEFVDWLHERYPELEATIRTYFSNQGFEDQMADLLSVFGPPGGECLLARLDGEPVGILMMKPHGKDECEMNRMFVRASARGHGVARALTGELFQAARQAGYKRMILSALDRHHEALSLYHKLGFVDDSARAPDSGNAEREIRLVVSMV